MNNSRSILELSHKEAKEFFMKSESYNTLDLPPYFGFSELLQNVDKIIGTKSLSSIWNTKPNKCKDVNYTLFNNKDGKYAWRPMQLIHPAIYVALVNEITKPKHWDTIKERFEKFSKPTEIKCLSLPVESLSNETDKAEQVSQWFQQIEQESVGLALGFEYIFHTDIENCYGSIYTHSIAWALHTKDKAKGNRNNTELIGVVIDKNIQSMSYGQTNGIPQGSVLMDFVAEMVLGYADLELSEKIKDAKIEDYHILRYRDDFRIFVNNPQDGEHILKSLTEVMRDLGMKLNSSKTFSSNDVVRSSIKPDKLHWLEKSLTAKSLQKKLLIIYNHAQQFPNSGSLNVALSNFHEKICKIDKIKIETSVMPMISIVVDIAFHNPNTYPIVSAILSKLISFLDSAEDKKSICEKIEKKFQKIPNTGYMEVWLQRFSMFFITDTASSESLCQLTNKSKVKLWSSEWISCTALKNCLNNPNIIDHDKKDKLEPIIPHDEIKLYISKYV